MVQYRDIFLKQQKRQDLKQDKREPLRIVITDAQGNQTGSGSIWANEDERRVWYMVEGAIQPGQALCRRISDPSIGLGARLGYANHGSNTKEVLEDDLFIAQTGDASGWSSTSPRDLEPGGIKNLWIYSKVITPLATYPAASGLFVNVIAGDYPYAGTRKTFLGQINIALVQNPNVGEHYYAGLYLDSANTLQVVYGTSIVVASTPPEPTWPAGAFRLSVVRVNHTQTSISFSADIVDRRLAWSDEQSSTSAATQAEVDAGTEAAKYVSPLTLSNYPPILLEVKNTSGFTVVANNVGYVVYAAASGLEFVYTSTIGQACVVVVGGANNATIKVATRGRYPLAYVGSAPAAGDFLIESFAFVDIQAYMSPAVIAIAMAAGSGGIVDAMMLTGSKIIPFASTNNLLALVSVSASDFVCTQNGAPSGANITYNAPSSGAENTINPTLSTELGKIVIHNTTRGTEAYLQATNTATNVMTFTSAADVSGWQNGDTLTARSQTNTDVISSAYFYDIAITSTELPPLTTAIIFTAQLTDTAASKFLRVHPWETGAASKRQVFPTQVASVVLPIMTQPISLYKKRFTIQWDANGSGTVVLSPLRLVGLVVATP